MKTPAAIMLSAALAGCMPEPAPISVNHLCRSWRHQTVSKLDKLTDETAAQIEGSNEARPAWGCQLGANRARRK